MNVIVTDPDAILVQDNYDPGRLAEAMLDRYYAALHYLAYSILGDADEADDAVQEGLIRALAKIDGYRPGSNMKAWLSSIVVNNCQDRMRRRKARQRLNQGLGWLLRGRPPRKTPEEGRVNEEAKTALWSTVNKLGEKHRTPIILRYLHDFSVREISQILNIREGTVYSRLHHACRSLGRQLAIDDREALIEELLNERVVPQAGTLANPTGVVVARRARRAGGASRPV
jgi:RNA polymerase sigma-70 factor (ECF subfamily)